MKFQFKNRPIEIDELRDRKVLSATADSKGDLFVYLDDDSLSHINMAIYSRA